jgi:anion-transporting  ArsA/GET3 family ATPase
MNQKIYFVTGKGGVGKSTVAAVLAYKLARQGKKTVLVELGKESFYADFFAISGGIGFKPQKTAYGFDLALLSPDECLKEYALHLLKLESLYKLFFQNPISKSLIEVAPGLKELSILGKITSKVRKHGPPLDYECIVVDAFATGHFISLVQAPSSLAEAVPYGPMGEQSRGIDAVLKNPQICEFLIVTLPEKLPMKEAVELQQTLHEKMNLKTHLVLNRSYAERLGDLSEADLSLEIKNESKNKVYIEQINKFMNNEKELTSAGRLPVVYEANISRKLETLARHLDVRN